MKKHSNKMADMPIRELVLSMAIPAMISMTIQALYNVVDSIFVSRVSEEALTAVSLAFPLQLLIIALVVGTSAGITSLISRRLGESNREEASKAASHGFVINMIYSVIMLLSGLFLAEKAVSLFTSDPYLIELTTQYISIIMIFSFGRLMAQAGISTLQGTGNMINPMKAMLVGAITNIILDPILIFGWFGFPALGVRGAAIATVTGQILSFVYISIVIMNGRHDVDIQLRKFRFDYKVLKDIYVVALPGIVMQSLGSVMLSGLNLILIAFTPTAVAVLGAYYKLQSIIIMPIFGLMQGYMPIMGYNYGSKQKDRMMDTLKFTLRIAFMIMLTGAIIIIVFPVQMLRLFDASPDMLEIGVIALRAIGMCLPLAAVGITFSVTFQAMGKGYVSLIGSFIRQMVVILPVAYLFSVWIGLNGVWFAFIVSEFVAIIIMGPWLAKDLKKTFSKWEKATEPIVIKETGV